MCVIFHFNIVYVFTPLVHLLKIEVKMNIINKSSKGAEISANVSRNQNLTDFATGINTVIADRTAMYRNSVLSSQIEKLLPGVIDTDKRGSLHAVLQQISEESVSVEQKNLEKEKKHVVLQIPRKSLINTEVILQEYVIPGREEKLLSDSFVRNLPVPIQEKRHYRKSISVSMKVKPWYTKVYDFISGKSKNLQCHLELWHKTLKIIEGQHGAAIVSYFVFIRWLLYMNIIIFLLNFFFLLMPQYIFYKEEKFNLNHTTPHMTEYDLHIENFHSHRNVNSTLSIDEILLHCQLLYSQQITNNSLTGFFGFFQNILQGTGPLEPTHLFLGFYPPQNIISGKSTYNVPFASLCIIIISFIICLAMMINYTSIGIQEAFLAHNKRSNYYSNEVFSAWDYCIDKPESAKQQHYRFVLEMKTNLSEDRVAKELTARTTKEWAKLYAIRIAVNIFILSWLFACYSLIYKVAVFQMRKLQTQSLTQSGFRTFFIQFLPSFTVITLNSISSVVFSFLVQFEKYHAQIEINLSLFRNVFLYLSSLMLLLNTFYQQTACKPKDICGAGLDENCRSPKCWETYIGQQMFKLSLTDLFVYIGAFVGHDVVRYYITENIDNRFAKLLSPLTFFLPTEVLAPVNSQTLLWLGVFYSPMLPAIMIIKLVLIFYIKKTKVLKFCKPSEHSFRASRFNAVFVMILLISFFTVLIVLSYAIENIPPSHGCGPFRKFEFMTEAVPSSLKHGLSFLTFHWTIIIITILSCLVIHYYYGVIISQKEMAKRLHAHLLLQSNDKQFLLKKIADLTDEKSSVNLK